MDTSILVIPVHQAHDIEVSEPANSSLSGSTTSPADLAASKVPLFVQILLPILTLATAGWIAVDGLRAFQNADEALTRELLDVKAPAVAWTDFELPTPDGDTVQLSKLAEGRTLVINFWATWCPPCVEEIPSLTRLYQRLRSNPNVDLIAVSADESMKDVVDFFDGDYPFPVVLDAGGRIAEQYGTTKFPETFILRDGVLIGHIIGPRDWDRWFAHAWIDEVTL